MEQGNIELSYKAIGMRIKIARIKKDMTQDQVAGMTGLSNTHISNIEKGRTKLSLPTLIKISNVLFVSIDELLCDNVLNSRPQFESIISDILKECSDKEVMMLADLITPLIQIMRKLQTCS